MPILAFSAVSQATKESAEAPAPHTRASSAIFASAASRLKRITWSIMMPLASPWCMSTTVPSACAHEWTAPRSFWKAMAPIIDAIIMSDRALMSRGLETAVKEPKNIAARSNMMMSSMMGAIAFQKDLGAVHSCAHALGTVVDMHHGLANGIMIDHVMRFNLDAAERKMAELSRVCGAGSTAESFVDWLVALKSRIGIPAKLGGKGVTREHIPRLVDIAVNDICHQTNPKPCSKADFEGIFTRAL